MKIVKAVLVGAVLLATAVTVSAAGATSGGDYALSAVSDAVVAGQSGTAVPATTTPSLAAAPTDGVDIGDCNAWKVRRSRICQFGDPTGKKTLVVFGNSHSNMWIPALSVAAKAAGWKFYPVVKDACGYDTYADIGKGLGPRNECTVWYDWAKTIIARLHPNVIILGSFTKTPYWQRGETVTITQLKALTKRFILLSDTPSIPSPAQCLSATGATQGSCLWPIEPARALAVTQVKSIATSTHVQFLDVTPWFCDGGLCPSVINDIIPYKDGAHLTPEYSTYLGPALASAIGLERGTVSQPVGLPLSNSTSTTTTSVG